MPKQKLAINKTKLLLEMLSIIVAVLLALGVEEWRDNLKKKNVVAAMKVRFKQEIIYNKKELSTAMENYRQSIKAAEASLAKLADLQAKIKQDPDASFEGFEIRFETSIPSFSTSAWQTGLANNVFLNMDLDTTQSLAELYDLQNMVSRQVNMSWERIMDPRNTSLPLDMAEDDKQAIVRWLLVTHNEYKRLSENNLQLSNSLLAQYEKTRTKLELQPK